MKTHAFRLKPDQDLKETLATFVEERQIKAGFILTCVGSLKKATLRLADETVTKSFHEKFEIVSLVGTLSLDGLHLHISLSDKDGQTIGGHLKEGCLIYSTAEIIVGEIEDTTFSREEDEQTGFKELVVQKDKKVPDLDKKHQ